MSSEPRPSTDIESAPLLQGEGGDSLDQHGAEQQTANTRGFKHLLSHPSDLTFFEKVLLAVSILLLCLAGIGFGLFAGEAYRLDESGRQGHQTETVTTSVFSTTTQTLTQSTAPATPNPTVTRTPSPKPNDAVCLSPKCVLAAAEILESIDTTVDPCQDFYEFSVGGWLREHPVPEDKGLFGQAQFIGEMNQRIIHSIIDDPPSSDLSSADRKNIEHLRAYYSSCLDEDALDRIGTGPLLEIVDTVRSLWNGSGTGKQSRHAYQSLRSKVEQRDLESLGELLGEEYFEIERLARLVGEPGERRPDESFWDWVRRILREINGEHEGKGKKKKPPHKKPDPGVRRKALTETLLYLHSRGVNAFFETSVDGDLLKDPNHLQLWLAQSGLGLPGIEYYSDDDVLDVYEEVVRASLNDVYGKLDNLTGGQSGTAKPRAKLAKEIVDFEKKIAGISLDNVDLEDPIATYNLYNSTELTSLFPSITWGNYFAGFSPRPAFPDPVVVTAPTFFANLTKIVDEEDADVLEGYFVWQTLSAYGSYLGPRETVRKEITQLDNYITGVDEGVRQRRSDVCLDSLLENFGFLVGRYYVQEAFPGTSKTYAETIIEATIKAFQDRLPELDWLDDKTRKTAQEKAGAITKKIGYPTSPNTTDPEALARYYSSQEPISRIDYFGNVVRSRTAESKRKWGKIGARRDAGEWDMIPSEVNAYYCLALHDIAVLANLAPVPFFTAPTNEIAFPAGILQKPYFNKDWPEYMAFGVFGSVAGHELSHAFDSQGRQFDKDGKLFDWWTNTTTESFERLKGCILDQYSQYFVVDKTGKKVFVNSRFTIGEDMADAGGLAQSFRAWSDRFAEDPDGVNYDNYLLPGLNFTREQLFYVAYARGWARNIKPGEAVRRIREDPHSPTRYRVIGPLSNDVEFSKAFNCPVGSPMNNKHKCKVW